METVMELQLKLANDNNKLACDGFIQIHFAPAEGVFERDLERVFVVPFNGGNIRVQLVDLLRIPFNRIGSVLTIPATGKDCEQWRKDWLNKYPKTLGNTEMAVYCYQRIEKPS